MSTFQRLALLFMKPALNSPDFGDTEPETCHTVMCLTLLKQKQKQKNTKNLHQIGDLKHKESEYSRLLFTLPGPLGMIPRTVVVRC